MASGVLRYKGYYAKPVYDPEDQIIYGKILGIDDLVDFYTETAKDVELEFHKAVDEYLSFCQEVGKIPQKAYSGTFNIRITEELHRDAAICAQTKGITLNAFVESAIKNAVEKEDVVDKVCKTAAMMVTTVTQAYNVNQDTVKAASQLHENTLQVAKEVTKAWEAAMTNIEC